MNTTSIFSLKLVILAVLLVLFTSIFGNRSLATLNLGKVTLQEEDFVKVPDELIGVERIKYIAGIACPMMIYPNFRLGWPATFFVKGSSCHSSYTYLYSLGLAVNFLFYLTILNLIKIIRGSLR